MNFSTLQLILASMATVSERLVHSVLTCLAYDKVFSQDTQASTFSEICQLFIIQPNAKINKQYMQEIPERPSSYSHTVQNQTLALPSVNVL